MIDSDRLLSAYRTARDDLLAERCSAGHWEGELSSSPLSTATAVSALALVTRSGDGARADKKGVRNRFCEAPGTMGSMVGPFWETVPDPFSASFSASLVASLIRQGIEYLAATQNADGGWGDTDQSRSNVATTMLARAAFHLAGASEQHAEPLARARRYVDAQGGVAGLRRRYGKDRTFAVPILTNAALAGLVGWEEVAPLPFELACLPYRLLRFLRLPVVSYAVPALVAVGQAGYFHRRPRNPLTRLVRRLAVGRSLQTLARMQPDSGGFLEATPLTSFVVMSLAGTSRAGHAVVRRGVEFLFRSVRPDGSWPIDTNLATWVTTLAINALDASGEEVGRLDCLFWLLECQHRRVHPFTNADPGGWGWTDLSGAVPDADDTAGALLALAAIRSTAEPAKAEAIDEAAAAGLRWLLDLQNADGGWPTFCRGWGALPFDRSGVDLSAHAIRALAAWKEASAVWTERLPRSRAEAAIRRGLDHLARRQRADGSWVPLWFGNQHHPAEENPVYGTARTLLAYRDLGLLETEPARRGFQWLAAAQGPDGGWGSGGGADAPDPEVSSVEETALAVETLLWSEDASLRQPPLERAVAWLVEAVESGRHRRPSPIGFYFAKLWYHERLYPLIFTVAALGSAARWLKGEPRRRLPCQPTSETAS